MGCAASKVSTDQKAASNGGEEEENGEDVITAVSVEGDARGIEIEVTEHGEDRERCQLYIIVYYLTGDLHL
jgi:hypothetical protein